MSYRNKIEAARVAGIAVEPRSPREVSQAQRRLSRLYGGRLWDILDRVGEISMWVALGIGIGVIIGESL